ncbi:MAG: hypothetical protein KKA16_05200 [Alphaproteobacteria bacterium]|nr:hypothetical protein [Alphaproteobacteria bacterium]MBU2379508.1 hypothetical protein [Alphaproteobacteria bacterium]
MTHNLDDLLTGLAAAPVDTALEGLEPLVWRRVDIFRGERLVSQLRLGAVAMALATGLTAGGFGAIAAPRPAGDLTIFTADTSLVPLARLDVVR